MPRAELRRFQHAAEEVASFLKSRLDGRTRIKVFSHMDADGIASAAILARCLYHYNVPFTVRFTLPLAPDEIAELAKEDHDMFIFLDQGSSQMDAIHKFILAKRRDVLVIDHHPGPSIEHPNLVHLNPHACGLNGGKDVSASGSTYSVVERVDLRFRGLVGLAIVGAMGDRQEFLDGFTGFNENLVKRAIELGLVYRSEGLRLIGRTVYPVVECLRLSIRPYILGLSGSLRACRGLVDTLGVAHESTLCNLGEEVERRLADAIFARVGPIATNEQFSHTLWGKLYSLTTDDLAGPRDLREYAAMLDACGNLGKPEVGFAAAMGDEEAVTEALGLMSSYQEQMLKALGELVKKLSSFKLLPGFRYFNFGDTIDPSFVGEALSLAIESGLIPTDRPVLGLVKAGEDKIKVSARSTRGLAAQGVNVGRAMAKTVAEVGGHGSGHDVAAAGRIPTQKIDEFLERFGRTLLDENK